MSKSIWLSAALDRKKKRQASAPTSSTSSRTVMTSPVLLDRRTVSPPRLSVTSWYMRRSSLSGATPIAEAIALMKETCPWWSAPRTSITLSNPLPKNLS